MFPRNASDMLSPILVKEFRQGVRGNIFTGAFLLLHGLMVLTMCLMLIEPSASQGMTAMFWVLLGLPVGVLIPLSGMQAVSSETTLKTLEPMLLTRLSPRGIVFGKWASLAVQNLILLVSIAPYFLLRYFLGGLQIAEEFRGIVVLVASSTVVTAVTVGLSAFNLSVFFRWLAFIPLMNMAFGVAVGLLANQWTAMGPTSYAAPALNVGLAVLTMLVMIEAGAWQIAPAADRSSAVARGAMLLWLPIVGLTLDNLHSRVRTPVALWTGLLLLLVVLGTLCEPQSTIPGVYSRYFARGWLRRLAGLLLAPGWPSGVLFAIVTSVGACFALQSAHRDLTSPEVILATVAQILLPLVLMPHITFPRLRPAAWYLIIQIASFSAGAMAPFGSELESPTLAHAAAWLVPLSPIMGLVMESEQPELTPVAVDTLSVIVACGIILLTLVQAVRALRRSVQLVRRSAPEAAGASVPAAEDAAPADPRVANL
jgi:ABC-type transport system involved in multi-copper enzyme maturation permease subunit